MAQELTTLDQSTDGQSASETAEQYLAFRTRDERYALPVAMVREIIEYGRLTPVPMMPDFIRGVINLRGHVVPVIDLSSRFGQGITEPGKRTCIIILELEETDDRLVLGLVVDAVDSVFDLEAADVEPPPRFGAGIRADFIAGMVKSEHGFIVMLDVQNVLSLEDMKRLAEAGERGAQMIPAASGAAIAR